MQPMPKAADPALDRTEPLPEGAQDLRAFLESLHCLRVRVQALREREDYFLNLADSDAYRSHASGSQANASAALAQGHARALRLQADTLMRRERAAERWISCLPNARHRDVLTLRYLNGWRFDRIAEALGLSAGRTYALQREALRLLAQCGARPADDASSL